MITRIFQLLMMFCLFALTSHGQSPDSVSPRSTIEIVIKGVPPNDASMISGAYTLAADGTIRLPMLPAESQAVRVVGKSAREVEDALIKAYQKAEIYAAPTFVVKIQTADAIKQLEVQVSGGVRASKRVPWTRDMTLVAAIADAGDLTDFGSRYITLTRNGKTQKYDYFCIRHRNIKLQPGDQIFVPQRGMFEARPAALIP